MMKTKSDPSRTNNTGPYTLHRQRQLAKKTADPVQVERRKKPDPRKFEKTGVFRMMTTIKEMQKLHASTNLLILHLPA